MAVDFLGSLQSYGGKFTVTNTQQVDTSGVDRIRVVDSEYGPEMCFFMKNGRVKYSKLSNLSTLQVDDAVKVDSVKVITLERDGEEINRVDGEKL